MKVQIFEIKDWLTIETGIVVAENDAWVLTFNLPFDYIIDGYKLIRKEHILRRNTPVELELTKRVLELKRVPLLMPIGFKFDSPLNILRWCEEKYGIFEFQDINDKELFYGKLKSVEEAEFYIDMIKADGQIDTDFPIAFDPDEIRTITFDSDYFHAIRLLVMDEDSAAEGQPSSDE